MYQSFQQMPALLEALKPSLRIAVIYGGDAGQPEACLHRTFNERHWKSYQAVADNIRETLLAEGFRHVTLLADDAGLTQRLRDERIQLAWLNTAGMQGRNSIAHTACLLESMGVAYVGHSPLNFALMDHKLSFKRLLLCLGLQTPAWLTWHPSEVPDKPSLARLFHQSFSGGGPWVVKPVSGRASHYIFTAANFNEVWERAQHVYAKTLNQVLIENYLPGPEYCVALGPRLRRRNGVFEMTPRASAFSFVERLLGEDETIFHSIDKVPLHRNRTRLLDPDKDAVVRKQLADVGARIYREMSLNFLVRMDLRTSRSGVVQVMEVNPKPDLKRPENGVSSLVALGLAEQDMSYADLIISCLAAFLDTNLRFCPRALTSMAEPLSQLDDGGRPWMSQPAQSM